MDSFSVRLKSINEVKEFVRIVNDFPYDVDLTSGRYVVDGKSIMGIFSLDLSKPLEVSIYQDRAEDLVAELRRFIVT